MSTAFFIGLVIGFALGAALAALYLRGRAAVAETKLAAASQLPETFQALADAALRSNQGAFLDTARSTLETIRAGISTDLARLESQIRELERARQQIFGNLQGQLQSLQQETATLANALRSPGAVRGRWGETTLRRVAELAGMVKYCDFVEQRVYDGDAGRLRPDMVVKLPGGRNIVVDAKAPLTAYLEAVSTSDANKQQEALRRHAQQVAKHVEQLSSRAYWSQFQPSPELVILFLPGDHFFSAALEQDPGLLEEAAGQKVLLATPTTLIAVLKGVAHGWRQDQLAENAEQIRQSAAELYERFQTVQGYYAETGRCLEKAVEAYNRSVGSWEARLLPSVRRMRELGATTAEESGVPERIDLAARAPGQIE